MAGRRGGTAAREASALRAGLARAVGGALIFALPMLMTMELWQLGFAMDRLRLALLVVLSLPLLVGVAHRVGFEPSFGWREDLRDAFVALGVGALAGAAILGLFNLLRPAMPASEVAGKVAIQAVPAALGALLARSQLGERRAARRGRAGARALGGYGGGLFRMIVGALFLGLNVAPTEEMMLISYLMTPWHALGLLALSVAVMHAFHEAARDPADPAAWPSRFLRVTLVGYAVVLAISLYVLWTFGRIDGAAGSQVLMATLVLAFPAALGAAAARLIL